MKDDQYFEATFTENSSLTALYWMLKFPHVFVHLISFDLFF